MNIRAVLAWLFGVLLSLLGLLLLISVPPIGILVLLVGLYILPPINRKIQVNISSAWALAWITGGLLLLFALTITHLVPAAGVIAVVGGLFALPPVRQYLTSWTDFELGRWTVVGVVFLVIVSSSATAAIALQNNERLGHETKVHEPGERFTVDSGETNLAFTVKAANKTHTISRGPDRERADSEKIYLVVTLQIENLADQHTTFTTSDFAAVSDDGQRSYEIAEETADIRSADPYEAQGLELATISSDRRLDAGETVTRTVAFEVETGRTYLFTIPATGPYSGADNHYVPLGKV
ncbi:DUF4352 domain-containing protein [Halobacterium sp. KA-4]|uniref:DUF4352 domain-containing protein n=1 Tax=Halobacterium sp. KA-4 TaxID=2896367 RepID=UPI001E3631DC|nr:DUF4352 domain-containing protein [Halobacterium sp. KA-4]MCD2201074.1 DUF4352 domain-containing protein [Halobacterium sp. KA-4]